jgi:hypothetical protein
MARKRKGNHSVKGGEKTLRREVATARANEAFIDDAISNAHIAQRQAFEAYVILPVAATEAFPVTRTVAPQAQ